MSVGLLPTILLAVWAPNIFEIFLGPNWRDAGEIARVLAPMLLLRFICNPVSSIYYVVGAQREDAFLTILMTFVTAILLIYFYVIYKTPLAIVIAYSIGESLNYAIYIIRSYSYASMEVKP